MRRQLLDAVFVIISSAMTLLVQSEITQSKKLSYFLGAAAGVAVFFVLDQVVERLGFRFYAVRKLLDRRARAEGVWQQEFDNALEHEKTILQIRYDSSSRNFGIEGLHFGPSDPKNPNFLSASPFSGAISSTHRDQPVLTYYFDGNAVLQSVGRPAQGAGQLRFILPNKRDEFCLGYGWFIDTSGTGTVETMRPSAVPGDSSDPGSKTNTEAETATASWGANTRVVTFKLSRLQDLKTGEFFRSMPIEPKTYARDALARLISNPQLNVLGALEKGELPGTSTSTSTSRVLENSLDGGEIAHARKGSSTAATSAGGFDGRPNPVQE